MSHPVGTTHIQSDGTSWKNEDGNWFYWHAHVQLWRPYVGLVNRNFLSTRIEVGVRHG